MINKISKTYILVFHTAQDKIKQYHTYSVLSQIFDTARNVYCIISDQYTDNSNSFFNGSESWYRQEETESLD